MIDKIRQNINSTTLLFTAAVFLVVIVIIIVLVIIFRRPQQPTGPNTIPTPTIVVGRQQDGSYRYTTLEKTTVGKTTEQELQQQTKILSKAELSDVTIYTVQSDIPLTTNEVRVKNNTVIFESINTQTNKNGNPPKFSTIEKELGQAEEVIDKVGWAWYITAFLYPSKGVAFFVNTNTDSVYEVQRFVPMNLAEYKAEYGSYIKPAPTPVGEYPY
jgi:hypothetical protein